MPNKFNLNIMRRLFNPQLSGKGKVGDSPGRIPFKTTLSPFAQDALRSAVPTGKGKYASATMELALRFLLALVGEIELEPTCESIALAVRTRKEVAESLRRAANYIENYIDDKG